MKKLFIIIIAILLGFQIQAQENEQEQIDTLRIIKCKAVSPKARVNNIHIDESERIWTATEEGLFRMSSPDFGTHFGQKPSQFHILNYKGGNFKLDFNKKDIEEGLGISLESITVTHYDEDGNLWLGTSDNGFVRLPMRGSRSSILKLNSSNSKLNSNTINDIFVDRYKRVWIATERGVLVGRNDKWKLYEKNMAFYGVAAYGYDVWLVADDILWMVDDKNRWIPGDMKLDVVKKGKINDMAFDRQGKLWIGSDILVRYDVITDKKLYVNTSKRFQARKINCLEADREGAVYVGTNANGLYKIEGESILQVRLLLEKGLSCKSDKNDARLRVKVEGGTGPYQYLWRPSTLSGTNPKDLGPGEYQVTVRDIADRYRVAKIVIAKSEIVAEAEAVREESKYGAKDGAAKVTGSGGTRPYTYKWDNGEERVTAQKLTGGMHTVTITDQAGCTTTAQVEVYQKTEKLKVSLEIVKDLECANTNEGELKAIIEGGKPPFTYDWKNVPGYKGDNPKDLGKGQYRVVVTDAENNTSSALIGLFPASPMKVTTRELRASSSFGIADGVAEVKIVEGKNAPFTYLWDNGETGAKAQKLNFGKHYVTITDSKGCDVATMVSINLKHAIDLNNKTMAAGQTIRINNLYFQADSTNFKTESQAVLKEVALFLQENNRITIEIGGHTNGIPEHEYCDNLSTARAKSVAKFLVAQGIPEQRVYFKGYGKRNPIATNSTSDGRKKNQRVEIKILKVEGG